MQLFVSLMVLLAIAPEASPQTGSSNPPENQPVARKTGNSRGLPARTSSTEASPMLCFQPGVGWQRIPPGQSNETVTRDATGEAATADPPSAAARPLSAKRANSAECGGTLTGQKELGAGAETHLNPNRAIRTAGAATSFHVHAQFPPKDSAGLNPIRTTPGALPSASTSASGAAPDELSGQGDGRRFHAYVSSIKLRRWIRNAPDFRTRKKLEQLRDNAETKSRHVRADSKTGKLAGKRRQGERVRGSSPCGQPWLAAGSRAFPEMACHP
jgi:hypothetical protein